MTSNAPCILLLYMNSAILVIHVTAGRNVTLQKFMIIAVNPLYAESIGLLDLLGVCDLCRSYSTDFCLGVFQSDTHTAEPTRIYRHLLTALMPLSIVLEGLKQGPVYILLRA